MTDTEQAITDTCDRILMEVAKTQGLVQGISDILGELRDARRSYTTIAPPIAKPVPDDPAGRDVSPKRLLVADGIPLSDTGRCKSCGHRKGEAHADGCRIVREERERWARVRARTAAQVEEHALAHLRQMRQEADREALRRAASEPPPKVRTEIHEDGTAHHEVVLPPLPKGPGPELSKATLDMAWENGRSAGLQEAERLRRAGDRFHEAATAPEPEHHANPHRCIAYGCAEPVWAANERCLKHRARCLTCGRLEPASALKAQFHDGLCYACRATGRHQQPHGTALRRCANRDSAWGPGEHRGPCLREVVGPEGAMCDRCSENADDAELAAEADADRIIAAARAAAAGEPVGRGGDTLDIEGGR